MKINKKFIVKKSSKDTEAEFQSFDFEGKSNCKTWVLSDATIVLQYYKEQLKPQNTAFGNRSNPTTTPTSESEIFL